MSLKETANSQPPTAEDNVATVTEPLPTKGHIGERGYSDSVVPSCRLSATKQLQMSDDGEHILKRLPTSQLDGASGRGAISLSERVRAARNLHLPSFASLGIAVPHPSALLTPPEDGLCAGLPLSPSSLAPLPPISPLGHPRSSSFPQSNAPRTPELFEMSVSSATFGSSSTIPQASAAQHQVQDSTLPRQLSMTTIPATEGVDTTVERVSWIAEAVDLVGELRFLSQNDKPTDHDSCQCPEHYPKGCQRNVSNSAMPTLRQRCGNHRLQGSHDHAPGADRLGTSIYRSDPRNSIAFQHGPDSSKPLCHSEFAGSKPPRLLQLELLPKSCRRP